MLLTVERGFRSYDAAGIQALEFEHVAENLAFDAASVVVAPLAIG